MKKNAIKTIGNQFKQHFCQGVFGFVFLVFVSLMPIACSNNSTAQVLMEETWREFRAIHPFGFQTVALKHYGDTCVFVMSEPDSWVKETDLKQLFNKYDGQLIIRYQPYGFDGQLTDAVGCATFDSISFHNFEKELFTILYKTDYKPYYTDLDNPIKHFYFSEEYNLNYSQFPFTFESDLNETFSNPFQRGESEYKTISELLDSNLHNSNEIFFSKDRGIITWIISTDSVIQVDSFLINARRFALDSDLILGSIPRRVNTNKIAIIAREREVPVTILPPLRSEAILQLASNTKETIRQTFDSYKKNVNDSTIATSISMTNWLENTEMGNLMVLTDVLLKSWSENGVVSDFFMEYSIPERYPFKNGVSHELGYIPIYSWIFFFDGETGSMPLEFSPLLDNMTTGKEYEIAFKTRMHFANLNCIDIVRATQYAAINQIFNGLKLSPKLDESWVRTPSWTISNKPWGVGGYLAQAKGLGNIVKKGIPKPNPRPIPRPRPTPLYGPRPIPIHGFYSAERFGSYSQFAIERYGDLSSLIRKHPEISGLVLDYPKFAFLLRERPHLAEMFDSYPYLAESLAKNPKIADELEKYPSLSTILTEYPKLAQVLAKHRELAKTLLDYPELADVLTKRPRLINMFDSYPYLAETLAKNPEIVDELEKYPRLSMSLAEYPQLSKVLIKHRELAKTLSDYPELAKMLTKRPCLADTIEEYPKLVDALREYPKLTDVLSRTPKLVVVLETYPMIAEELAIIPNLADLSEKNPHFAELLSQKSRASLRESLGISSSPDIQRGLDRKVHVTPASHDCILSKPQVQEIINISTQKNSKMIELRKQIKQQINKSGIRVKDVKWEINNTLKAYIKIDQHEEELKHAA